MIKLVIFLALLLPLSANASFSEYYNATLSYQKEIKALATPELKTKVIGHTQEFDTCINNTLSQRERSNFPAAQNNLLSYFYELYKYQPAYKVSLLSYKRYLAKLQVIKSSDPELRKLVLVHRAGYALQAYMSSLEACQMLREWRYRRFSWQRRPLVWYSLQRKVRRVLEQERNFLGFLARATELSSKSLKLFEVSSIDNQLWDQWFLEQN